MGKREDKILDLSHLNLFQSSLTMWWDDNASLPDDFLEFLHNLLVNFVLLALASNHHSTHLKIRNDFIKITFNRKATLRDQSRTLGVHLILTRSRVFLVHLKKPNGFLAGES